MKAFAAPPRRLLASRPLALIETIGADDIAPPPRALKTTTIKDGMSATYSRTTTQAPHISPPKLLLDLHRNQARGCSRQQSAEPWTRNTRPAMTHEEPPKLYKRCGIWVARWTVFPGRHWSHEKVNDPEPVDSDSTFRLPNNRGKRCRVAESNHSRNTEHFGTCAGGRSLQSRKNRSQAEPCGGWKKKAPKRG